MQDYFKAAPKDKVLLSDESKGEVMIAEGAADYVPPTKMEDWVWPYPRQNLSNKNFGKGKVFKLCPSEI